jgi:GT2 family glycosyltransferase
VHDALDHVIRCLESVTRHTGLPYSLIVVDDGSNEETARFLAQFADSHGALPIRNEQAHGYTKAANQGLRYSEGEYVVLLNSDTVVTSDWLDRMIACAESDPRIGMVGPLSNTASWQSIPEIINQAGDDWAENRLPDGMTADQMGRLVAQYSGRLYPRIPFLNGFCLMIKRNLIKEIGYFDEEAFGKGYGEENDYCLRAREALWQLAVADDAYVFHGQSRSYSHEQRRKLSKRADKALAAKHGRQVIQEGVLSCRFDRVLEGIRARSRIITTRQRLIENGRVRWKGKRILFLLPAQTFAGGVYVVLQEAEAMLDMGVNARILNMPSNRAVFERCYPDNTIPVTYAEKKDIVASKIGRYDAIIATLFTSVGWLQPLTSRAIRSVKGYYIQDFEPHFFPMNSRYYKMAWNSYTRYPDMVRLTKTEWNRNIVKEHFGVDCTIVGPSVDIDLYRPRPRHDPGWPHRPLRVAAMIRPSTPRRQAQLTMKVLRELDRAHGRTVEIILFGCRPNEPDFLGLPRDFSWRHAGLLSRAQHASLLNEVDIVVDFSTWQAMGLTPLEAMGCGAAVVVPRQGGATTYAKHGENSLVVDTRSEEECYAALERLVVDQELRNLLQRQAIADVCQYPPEKAAYNILDALFPGSC